ncbi:MAG TPA: adenylate/guanylate cyclase domain-containing protein [Candidatus Eremiobacteraceae bacterium]|nr:adenylate/guanylate cyclase domain-containing protein [Candidatus Eremiobacteraceae bacterium]
MPWSESRSKERVEKHLANMGEINVSDLVREVDDLEAILSETECRNVLGAHVYVDISNFAALAADKTMSSDGYKRLIQALHVYQCEATDIVEGIFDGYRVHFQGSRAHALLYRPVNDAASAAKHAALLLLVMSDFVRSVFNAEFDDYADWRVGGGADVGDAIGTKNGKRGDRELLFIGDPANQAAKIMRGTSSLMITPALYEQLPDDIRECCLELSDGNHKMSADRSALDDLCAEHGIKWDREACAARLADGRKALPLRDIECSEANEPVDLSRLSPKNSKRVCGASVFSDISGFTKYVADAVTDEEKASALRVFHVIRKESTKVISADYPGVRIQFQGDRVQALFHTPKDHRRGICSAAVNVAISLQSSLEQVIKKVMPEAAPLKLAVGVDVGTTLVTRLGSRGDRDNVCLGTAVEQAARLEEASSGGSIAISADVYAELEEELQSHFVFDENAGCYRASNLTWESAELKDAAAMYDAGGEVTLEAIAFGAVIGVAAVGAAAASKRALESSTTRVQPARSYAPAPTDVE